MSAIASPAPASHPHPAFRAMLAALAANPPVMFATDVTVHDARALTDEDPAATFAWYLYASGSHLLRTSPQDRLRSWTERDVVALVTRITRDFAGGQWWLWDGATFRVCAHPRRVAEALFEAGQGDAVTCGL